MILCGWSYCSEVMATSFLFDIGNVIITFDFKRAIDRIADRCSIPPEHALQLVTELSPALERGDVTTEDFISQCIRAIGFKGTPEEFRETFEDIFELNHPMVAYIEAISVSDADLFLLSNTNGIHVPFFEKTYPVFDRFHGRIYSHQVGFMKPAPEIYEIAISSLKLIPEETIYVDDSHENCAAGRIAGLNSVCYDFTDHDAFLEQMRKMAPDYSI